MTEQELLNKLNTVVSMAQEKILALLTDLHNEQAVAKAREVFSNYPVVLETIDVQKNEFGKTTQVGGYATPDRIVISQNDIQSIDLNTHHELESMLINLELIMVIYLKKHLHLFLLKCVLIIQK